jgi:hypothetical protein
MLHGNPNVALKGILSTLTRKKKKKIPGNPNIGMFRV